MLSVINFKTYHQKLLAFAHVADPLLENIVAMLIHMCAQKVLEAVVNLQTWGSHGYPLPHRMTLHILQVLNTLNHLFILAFNTSSFCCTLCQAPSPLWWPLIILIFTIWMKKKGVWIKVSRILIDVWKTEAWRLSQTNITCILNKAHTIT